MDASVITGADFTSVLTTLQEQLSVANIVSILGILAGACVGFVFMWWGVRKLSGALVKSAKSGKMPV